MEEREKSDTGNLLATCVLWKRTYTNAKELVLGAKKKKKKKK
eukprot:SAG11_NODE_37347_length_257_cov_0.784810_1_plen_41_part_10